MKQRFHHLFSNIKSNIKISARDWMRIFFALPICMALIAPAAWAESESKDDTTEQSVTEHDSSGPTTTGQSPTDFFVSQLGNVPAPTIGAKAWASYDVNSGQFISAYNLDDPIEPASITKLMTAYLVFEALENNRLQLDQEVNVS